MWMPKTESEIIQAVQSGSVEESAIFDAKEALPTKNQEIAKDIAAMANDGGVIIYGIGEDGNGRVTKLTPIPLEGQAERIDAIVRSSIAEPLLIHLTSIPTSRNPAIGYLVVYIPPSERAPHMVEVKNEYRYYGRSATGNTILPEGEVSRLYARRKQTEVDREKLLDAEINAAPYSPKPDFAYLFLYARPLFVRDNFLDACLKNGQPIQRVFYDLIDSASQPTIFPHHTIYPDFHNIQMWGQRAESFWGPLCQPNDSDSPEAPGDTLNMEVEFNGTVHLFCGGIAEKGEKRLLFFPERPSITAQSSKDLVA